MNAVILGFLEENFLMPAGRCHVLSSSTDSWVGRGVVSFLRRPSDASILEFFRGRLDGTFSRRIWRIWNCEDYAQSGNKWVWKVNGQQANRGSRGIMVVKWCVWGTVFSCHYAGAILVLWCTEFNNIHFVIFCSSYIGTVCVSDLTVTYCWRKLCLMYNVVMMRR